MFFLSARLSLINNNIMKRITTVNVWMIQAFISKLQVIKLELSEKLE